MAACQVSATAGPGPAPVGEMPWGDAAHARAEQHPRAVPTRQADIETMAALTKVGSTAVWASCNPPARGEHPTLLSPCTADTGERVQGIKRQLLHTWGYRASQIRAAVLLSHQKMSFP